jgi:hypothetical protein
MVDRYLQNLAAIISNGYNYNFAETYHALSHHELALFKAGEEAAILTENQMPSPRRASGHLTFSDPHISS